MRNWMPYITINESPDMTKCAGPQPEHTFTDPDAFCFAYDEAGNLMLADHPGLTHGRLNSHAGRGSQLSPGRLWTGDMILSFWRFSPDHPLSQQYIDDINRAAEARGFDWRVTADWRVEAWTQDDVDHAARKDLYAENAPSTAIPLEAAMQPPAGIAAKSYDDLYAAVARARVRLREQP